VGVCACECVSACAAVIEICECVTVVEGGVWDWVGECGL
jgi:hypothetical protein